MMKHQDLIGYRIKTYNILRILGQGQFSIVYQAFNDHDSTTVAIKAMPMHLFNNKKIKELAQTQIKIMKSLRQNPNIVKFIDNFKNDKTIFIVMQLCDGGTLQDQIQKKKGMSEDDAKEILIQLINGFKGLHQFNIIHRDFKADNIMVKGDKYKIADLGFAKMLEDKNQMSSTSLGTAVTLAPQVYKGEKYGMKADIWSLGIVFYQMIYGKYPYYGTTDYQIFQQSKKLPSFSGVNISQKTKDFIIRCLTFKQQERISWAQLYEHPLLNQRPALRSIGSVQSSQFFNLNRFYYKNKKSNVLELTFDQNISEMELKQAKKIETMAIEKVRLQNERKKKMQATIKQYKDRYMNYRNNMAVLLKYVFPNACYLNKLPIKHEHYLFILCKCTYQHLKQLQIQAKAKINFLNLKQYFDQFTKSAHYKQLMQIFSDDAILACLQTCEYNPKFDPSEISNGNLDEQMKQYAFEYMNLLTDGLDKITKQFPRQKLILMIQALEHVRKDRHKQKYQNFEKYIQTLDFDQAVKILQTRQMEQLSQLYS